MTRVGLQRHKKNIHYREQQSTATAINQKEEHKFLNIYQRALNNWDQDSNLL
jgi:hypothetical protein